MTSQLDGDRWELLSSTIVSLAARILGAGAQFAFTVMLGRLLGAQGMGLYVLALSVCTLASVLGRFGMDLSILRFVALHRGQDQRSRLKHGWKTMILYACILSSIIAAALFMAAPYVAEYAFSKSGLTAPLRWMALSIVPFAMLNLLAESLRAVKRIGEASLVQAALLPGFCIILFWLLSRLGLGIEGAVLAYVVSTVLVLILAYVFWRRAVPGWAEAPARDGPTSREILAISVPMAWVSVTSVLMGWADTVILGLFRPAGEVGVYSATMRVSILVSLVLVAVNSILAPKFAALYREGDRASLERLAQYSTKLMLLLSAPLLVVFILVPGTVLRVFGEEFSAGATALVILSLGQFVNVSAGSVGLLLLMTGFERRMQWLSGISILCNILLCLLLVPAHGMTGAAIGNATGLVTLNVLALIATRRRLKISTTPWISIAGKS